MLGGIIDYLLGPGATSTSLDPVETQRKRADDTIDLTETTEDDFIVVTDSTKTKGRRGDDDEEWVVVDTWQRKESDDEEDNGWVVAPPECFRRAETTTGMNVDVESTDMENLLIEHPSMSVYVMRAPVVRRRSTSAARLSRSDHDERRVARARLAHALGAVPTNRNVRKTDAAPTRCCQAKKVRVASKLGNLVHQRWSSSKQKKVVRQKIVCPRKSY